MKLLHRLAMPSPASPITMRLEKSTAIMLHPPKPPSVVEDHPIAGLPCTRFETSAWILEAESMLHRVGGNMETSTTSCGLGIKLIAITIPSFLVIPTLAARGFVDYGFMGQLDHSLQTSPWS